MSKKKLDYSKPENTRRAVAVAVLRDD